MELFEAVKNGDIEHVERLLKAGADPNIQNEDGVTPLHCSNSSKITQFLREARADPHIKDKYGVTPLHYSISPEITKLLLQAGANPNIQNEWDCIPLQKNRHYVLLNFNSSTDFYTTEISIFQLN